MSICFACRKRTCLMGQFLASFREYPQRQKAASFNLDEVMAKLKEAN
jgi:hypothetical protein